MRKPTANGEADAEPTSVWDAGDMGCGELIILLRARILALAPGQALRVVATDLGAPEDLPAWSRLTGHQLVRAEHPVYDFVRRPEPHNPGKEPR